MRELDFYSVAEKASVASLELRTRRELNYL